jgi:hypothetical protein
MRSRRALFVCWQLKKTSWAPDSRLQRAFPRKRDQKNGDRFDANGSLKRLNSSRPNGACVKKLADGSPKAEENIKWLSQKTKL